jgi:hypothetical protein
MMQPIGSRLHGVLDYATGASLLAASQLPPLKGRFAGRLLGTAGASHIAYPMHLAVDAAAAFGMVALGATRSIAIDRWVPIAVGLYELGAVALSDPSGRGA